jgi:hypothetical protein
LEFEDYCQDYYSEIDSVVVTGYEHYVAEKIVGLNLNSLSDLFMTKLETDDEEISGVGEIINNIEIEQNVKLIDIPVGVCLIRFSNGLNGII